MFCKLYRKNPIKFIEHSVITAICVVLAVSIAIVLSQYYLGDESRRTIVITNSMEPVIMVNGVVDIEHVDFQDIQPNDIIRFNSILGYSVVHRVVAVGNGYLVTKGDNNDEIDSLLVRPEDVTGRVCNINNNYADLTSTIFGRFDTGNFQRSAVRIILGFLALSVAVSAVVIAVYYAFDTVLLQYFWTKKPGSMQESIAWIDETRTVDDLNTDISNYSEAYKKSGLLVKLLLIISFSHLMDIQDTERKKAERVIKARRHFNNMITKILNK